MKRSHCLALLFWCASSPAMAQLPAGTCTNLLAMNIARIKGLPDCDATPIAAGACAGVTADVCAGWLADAPPLPRPASGTMRLIFSNKCPGGVPNCPWDEVALCADGSRPAFFIAPAVVPSDNWLFYFSGGGSCVGGDCIDDYDTSEHSEMTTCSNGCVNNDFARSSVYAEATPGGILSNSPGNPFRDFNRVRMRKCTYDGYRGDTSESWLPTSTGLWIERVHHHGYRVIARVFEQLAAGGGPPGFTVPALANAQLITIIGNSGGGATVALTGDALRDLVRLTAPQARVRLVVDAHYLPHIQHEATVNATHLPPAPPNEFLVPWGGSGKLPLAGGCPPAPAPCSISRKYDGVQLRNGGLLDVAYRTYNAKLDASCLASHADPSPCNDEMHVLLHHLSTPFAITMDQHDSVLRDGRPNYAKAPAYTWQPPEFTTRVQDSLIQFVNHYAARSELATGARFPTARTGIATLSSSSAALATASVARSRPVSFGK